MDLTSGVISFFSVPYTDNFGRLTPEGEKNRDKVTCFGGKTDINGDGVLTPYCTGEEPFGYLGRGGNLLGGSETTGGHWNQTRDTSDVSVFTGRFDLTSQVTRVLQIKTGAELIINDFSLNYKRVNLAIVGPEPRRGLSLLTPVNSRSSLCSGKAGIPRYDRKCGSTC